MHWLTVRLYACAVSDKKILLNFTLSTLVNFKTDPLVIFFIFSMNLNQIEADLMKVCVCAWCVCVSVFGDPLEFCNAIGLPSMID